MIALTRKCECLLTTPFLEEKESCGKWKILRALRSNYIYNKPAERMKKVARDDCLAHNLVSFPFGFLFPFLRNWNSGLLNLCNLLCVYYIKVTMLFRITLLAVTETCPKPNRPFKMKLFAKIVIGWKPLTIFTKRFTWVLNSTGF